MKQALSLLFASAFGAVVAYGVWSPNGYLSRIPGFAPLLLLCVAVVFGGAMLQWIEDAHERRRGARPK